MNSREIKRKTSRHVWPRQTRARAPSLNGALRPCYTRQFFLPLFVARQVARKISRVTPQFCNLQRQQNVALRVSRKVEISCVWHVHRNLRGNFVKIRQSEPVFCSQEISSWRRKSCKQFPLGALQVAKKYCERGTPPLQLAMFFSRHRCETSCKKNCEVHKLAKKELEQYFPSTDRTS